VSDERRGKWGKAGVRLDPDDRAHRRAVHARNINQRRASEEADKVRAYQRWRQGLVCPDRITTALNVRSLYGPEVDRACKAQEPEVDQWEAGERYPTWEQLLALAALTGYPTSWFTTNDSPSVKVWQTSLWHTMNEGERAEAIAEGPAAMTYPRAVLDARPPSPAEMPDAP
jgi:hypothetical protein